MAQLIVRNLEESVKDRLERRAKRHARSMEEEVREILRNAVRADEGRAPLGLGTRIARIAKGIDFPDAVEWRGSPAKAATFPAGVRRAK